MGDRTTVELTLREADYDRVKDQPWFDEPEEVNDGSHALQTVTQTRSLTPDPNPLVHLTYHEVNYGELNFLHELRSLGIAFTNEWEDGGDYGPGWISCRFTDQGELQHIDISTEEENPPLSRLMELVNDNDLESLAVYIKDYHDRTTPLPWDNQEENGKLYRARQLIKPKE